MKTTIDIENGLWLAVKKRALEERVTLSDLVERALKKYLEEIEKNE